MNRSRIVMTHRDDCLICIDAGTTNTRVWLTRGAEVIARAQTMTGVRDTARDGSNQRLRAALGELIAAVRAKAALTDPELTPASVLAAGMITSPLGLAELPHVPAPAGISELAAATECFNFPDITELPALMIPGVRCGPDAATVESIGQSDVMRGEETLCAGLIAAGRVLPPATVLNLGSHWKAIQLDAQGRIAASRTSLSGEMIHATQTATILAGAVPSARPTRIDAAWLAAGMREQRESGLARALFCVRLLELRECGTAEERLAFLIGAFLAADFDALVKCGALATDRPLFVTGAAALAEAWRKVAVESSITAFTLTEAEIETAFLAGLRHIARWRDARLDNPPGRS
jgi:2-dehydro-3-deoxygalactonokinase